MDAIATHWKTLVRPGRTLADYGKAGNLLECVPTYINEVPSFNAANIWMMRRVADLQAAEGNQARAGRVARRGGPSAARRARALRTGTGRLGLAAPRRHARSNAPRL